MTMPAEPGGCCPCGAIWFRLVASAECDEPGLVSLDDRGNVTAHAGEAVCASCGRPWATPRARLSVVPADERAGHPTTLPPDRPNVVQAPFTPDQVRALNDWQANTQLHPFTCALDRHPPGTYSGPFIGRHGQQRVLVATSAGWVCSDPNCRYVQDWAHAAMTT